MITIFKYELQKVLKWKGIYIAAVLLILINALYIFSNKPSSLSHYRSAYKYYKAEEGYVTAEKIKMAEEGMKEINKLYHDGIRFDEKNLGKSILYKDISTAVIQGNEYKKILSDFESNGVKNEKEKLILKQLKNVGPIDSAYYTEGWKQIIKYTWSIGYYFTALLVLLGVSLIFPQEYSSGMYMIVNSTKESRRKLIYAKISVVIVFAGLVTISFAVINVLVNWYIYGLNGWNTPLKNIYYNTPYNIKIWQFFLLQQLLHVLSASIFGLFTMLISVVSKNSVISISLGGVVFIVLNGISRLGGDKAAPGSIGFIINDLIDLKGIFANYKNIYSIFSLEIQYEWVLSAVILILLMLMVGAIYTLYRKRNYINQGGMKDGAC